MDIFRTIRVLLDPKSGQDLERDTKAALDKGTDPKKPQKNLSAIESAMGKLKKAAIGLGATLAGAFSVRAITNFMRSSIDASIELETSRIRLTQALRNEGIELSTVNHELQAFTKNLWETHRLTEGEINPVLQQLITITGDYETSLRGVGIAADLAAAANMDVQSASRLLGRVINGETNALRRYGITIEEGADALDVLEEKLAGMAKAATPATEALSKAFGDLKEEIGFAIREATGFDDSVEKLTGRIVNLKDNTELLRNGMQQLVRAVRDLTVAITIAGAVRGLAALRTALLAAGGGANFLYARLVALNVALGPVGWITLALSGLAVMLLRVRDRAKDAAAAIKEVMDRREEARTSEDLDLVRRALIEAQEQLAKSRAIMNEQRRLRRAVTEEFKQQLRDEAATVEQLSQRYIDLVQASTEARQATADSGAGGAGAGVAQQPMRWAETHPMFGIRTNSAEEAERRWGQAIAANVPIIRDVKAVFGEYATLREEKGKEIEEAEELREQRMIMRAQETAWAMADAFQPFFDGMVTGLLGIGSFADEMLEALTGFGAAVVREMIAGKAEMNMAEAIAKLAAGTWPPQPAALKSAALHMSAAAAFRGISAAGRRGGSSGSGMPNMASTTRPSSIGGAMAPEINIYIDPLNPTNPAWQSTLAQTMTAVSQRYGTANVNVRPRT